MRRFYPVSFLFMALLMCRIDTSLAQWTKITPGNAPLDFTSIVVIPNGSMTNLFVSTFGNGVYISSNNGTTWATAHNGLTDEAVFGLAVSGTNLFAGTSSHGVFLSTDNGNNWAPVSTGLPVLAFDSALAAPITALAVSGSTVFAGTSLSGIIYQSTTNGASWTNSETTSWGAINGITVSGSELFAATLDGVFSSIDKGQTWSPLKTGFGGDTLIESVGSASNGAGGTNLFAGVVLNGEYGGTGGIFVSTNGGTSWSPADSGIENFPLTTNYYWTVTCFASSGTNVFAGTDGGGLYLSTNQGKFWTRIDQGLSDTTFVSLLVYHDTLYATSLLAVYRRPVSQLTAVIENKSEIPSEFSLSQNYPNPFNPSTMIQFTVPSSGRAVLKVFNILGEEVATLFNSEAAAGENRQVEFNASNLASGIYFSRLEFDGKMQMKKMMLLK